MAAQADQAMANLEKRAAMGIVAPKFVFPLVLDASRKLLQGRPFTESDGVSTIMADFTKKVGALKEIDDATRNRLLGEAKEALLTSFQPAYRKLSAYLEQQEKTATDDVGACLRQFHDVVLTNGPVPLDVLEESVNRWVKQKQGT